MKLGIVRIEYNKEGEVTMASFKPSEFKHFDKRLLGQLREIEDSEEVEKIQYNAEMIFSGWVSEMGNIDLQDLMLEKRLVSKVLNCEKYEDGLIRICEMEFSLEENEIKN